MSLLKISSGERDSGSFKILHNTLHSWWRVPCSFFLSQSPYQEINWSSRESSSWFLPFSSMTAAEGTRGSTENEKKTSTARNALRCTFRCSPRVYTAIPNLCICRLQKLGGKLQQRISPPRICQKSFLSVTAEKLRVNSLLIEKNIGFVKSQTPEWSAGPFSTCAEPNTCTPCLFTFFSPFSGDRGSKVRITH